MKPTDRERDRARERESEKSELDWLTLKHEVIEYETSLYAHVSFYIKFVFAICQEKALKKIENFLSQRLTNWHVFVNISVNESTVVHDFT